MLQGLCCRSKLFFLDLRLARARIQFGSPPLSHQLHHCGHGIWGRRATELEIAIHLPPDPPQIHPSPGNFLSFSSFPIGLSRFCIQGHRTKPFHSCTLFCSATIHILIERQTRPPLLPCRDTPFACHSSPGLGGTHWTSTQLESATPTLQPIDIRAIADAAAPPTRKHYLRRVHIGQIRYRPNRARFTHWAFLNRQHQILCGHIARQTTQQTRVATFHDQNPTL